MIFDFWSYRGLNYCTSAKLFTSELTSLSEFIINIWHQTYSTMFVNKWKDCYIHVYEIHRETLTCVSHCVYMFVLHHVCLCVGVMGKWNWDPKHWMMFCIGPSWSYCPKRCWWVQSLFLCYYHTSLSSVCFWTCSLCVSVDDSMWFRRTCSPVVLIHTQHTVLYCVAVCVCRRLQAECNPARLFTCLPLCSVKL